MDVNCGTLPSPPSSLCAPYPSLFPPPPSPSELGFYSHHSAFPFIAAAAASSNHSGMIFNYFSFIIAFLKYAVVTFCITNENAIQLHVQ